MVVVSFDEDFRVTEGLKLSRETVEDLFVHRAYVNGRIITVTSMLRADPRVRSVDLSQSARDLHG